MVQTTNQRQNKPTPKEGKYHLQIGILSGAVYNFVIKPIKCEISPAYYTKYSLVKL